MLKRRRAVILSSIISLGVILAMNFLWKGGNDNADFSNRIEEKISKVITDFDADFINILMNNRPDRQISFSTLNAEANHSFYLFTNDGKLVYWSDITMIPSFSDFVTNKKYQLIDSPKGVYFAKLRRLSRNRQGYWVLQTYPLVDKVEIQNRHLTSGFNTEVFGNDRFVLSSDRGEGYSPIYLGDEYLFSIFFRVGYEPAGQVSNRTLLVFFFSLLGLVFISGGGVIKTLWSKGNRVSAIFYTALILATVRCLMLFFSFPQDFFDTDLFSPSNYASSWVNPSLGDLLLNIGCLVLLFIMVFVHWGDKRFLVTFLGFRKKYAQSLLVLLAYIFSTLFLVLFFGMFMDIVGNSQWNLNVQTIPTFNYLKAVSLLIIFLGGMVYFLFAITSMNMVLYKAEVSKKKALNLALYVSVPIAGYLFYADRVFLVAFLAHFLLLGAIISFELYKNVFRQGLGLETFLTFFFGCLMGAVIVGSAAYHHTRLEDVQSKRKFAEYVMVEDDVMGNYLLGEVMESIRNDVFISTVLSDPLLSKEPIIQKIKKIYLTNYLDKFSSSVRVFNRTGENLINRESSYTLDDYRAQYMNSDYATSVRNLYYIKGAQVGAPNKFIAFISIYRDRNFLGTVMLELTQQPILASSVFPKLLMDMQHASSIDDQWYDYAIFDEGILQFGSGIFNFRNPGVENLLSDPKLFTTGLVSQGYHHFAVQDGDSTILVSSPAYPNHYIYADVALFFVVFLIMTMLSVLLYTLFFGLDKLKFNYATKLQFYLNFAFFFPMLVISVVAVGFLSRSYTEDLHRKYFEKATIIRDHLAQYLEIHSEGFIHGEELTNEIYSLASTTNTDINIYKPNGRLMETNQPKIFEKSILTDYLNPKAYAALLEMQNNRVLLEEVIGNLVYKTVYLVLRDAQSQRMAGIIAIPFFESEEELNELISDVVSNILIIFVVIFIVFLIISYFISKNLAYPFRLLTQKLKTTNLESNEYMKWPSQDEIGLLVSEYNNMLSKLEASKKTLASNEKESAWREMAKQVAHEIKNPLTPMKLTLQHLLRLQTEGRLEDPESLKKPITTLIRQVDTLSDIATSFSAFAKMPMPKNESMDLRLVVLEAIELYMNRGDVRFTFTDQTGHQEPIRIIGDAKLFGRVISNLIINGIQSVDKTTQPVIHVTLSQSETEVKLEIKDNGKGIPEEVKEKIFIPNFSTKSEGSGLGLAIAKRGVETAGGGIWFKTQVDVGTSFYLTFPLIR